MKKSKKNILVVGGTGFIGYHLIKKSLKNYYNVTSISSKKPSKPKFLKKVKYIICDIRNFNQLKKKIDNNFDYVVNLGGYVDHTKKKETYTSHYYGCKNLAKIFLEKSITSFVQIGSGLEYGKLKTPHKEEQKGSPNSTYASAKYKATKYLISLYKTNKIPISIIRLYQAYGPEQEFNRLIPSAIKRCLQNEKFPCTKGLQKRDFLYIDDLINLIFKILKSKKAHGQIINAGSEKPIQVRKLIHYIKKISKGGKPEYGKIKMRKDEPLNMYPSIKKAKRLFKWKPKFSIQKGLKKTIKFYSKII